MNMLILATAVFLAAHLGLSAMPLRGVLVGALGDRAYQGLFALTALATLVWMSIAYGAAPDETLWTVGPVLGAVPLVVLPFALLGLVCGVSGPNPTSAGPPAQIDAAEPARGILRVTRHPVNMSIGLWAAAHIVARGEAAALVFFGGLLVLAVAGPPLMERRKRVALAGQWEALAAVTSIVPFAAIAAGRNRLVAGEIGWTRLAVALALYAMLIAVHPYLFGVPVY